MSASESSVATSVVKATAPTGSQANGDATTSTGSGGTGGPSSSSDGHHQQQTAEDDSSPPEQEQQQRHLLYACKQCRLQLFTTDHLVPHDNNDVASGHKMFQRNKFKQFSGAGNACTSVFLDESRLPWVTSEAQCSKDEDPRDLLCPNPKCRAKLGLKLWQGTQCSCGAWVTPAFKVTRSRVDVFGE